MSAATNHAAIATLQRYNQSLAADPEAYDIATQECLAALGVASLEAWEQSHRSLFALMVNCEDAGTLLPALQILDSFGSLVLSHEHMAK
jgi:hypothetical protein